MDRARYVVALILLLSWPPGMLLWFAIHPFVGFWRKLGPGWTYTILLVPSVALAMAAWRWRSTLLGTDLGTNYWSIALAVLLVVPVAIIATQRKKYLTLRILAGVPELSRGEEERGTLLREGIYGVIRHPRYVEALLGVCTYGLFVNYVGIYVLVALSFPMLFLVVLIEERELLDRFGAEYEAYRREVPRFVPRRWVRALAGRGVGEES